MTDCLLLDVGKNCPDVFAAVTEIPLGRSTKYKFDKKRRFFELDQNLRSLVLYSADYGLIPQPLANNGDSLDLLARTFHVSTPCLPCVANRPFPNGRC